jgi:hypothetical protein
VKMRKGKSGGMKVRRKRRYVRRVRKRSEDEEKEKRGRGEKEERIKRN